MNDIGNWLIGTRGTQRVIELTQQLHSKIKMNVEEATGKKFDRYVPWMSAIPFREQLQSIFEKSELPEVLVDQSILGLLNDVFNDPLGMPLGKLGLIEERDNYKLLNEKPEVTAPFVEMFLEAKAMFLKADALLEKRYNAVISTIIPLDVRGTNSSTRTAFSSHLLKGAIFRGVPESSETFWKLDLAIDFAHELGHQILIIYQSADRIISSDFAEPVLSAVRKVERPSIMSFHAVVALVYMVEYLRAVTSNQKVALSTPELQYAIEELNRYESDLVTGLASLASVSFTPIGNQLYSEMVEFSRAKHARTS